MNKSLGSRPYSI